MTDNTLSHTTHRSEACPVRRRPRPLTRRVGAPREGTVPRARRSLHGQRGSSRLAVAARLTADRPRPCTTST
ncbi:hypothetical protein E2C01_070282 [Portunus trituberculatus]|uniref:Uncharacterized protein n=1 Tax=Portunus trituberculatus TaxID=210409 RepID=A0A5B7I164_PORTR|nr:hypothetical protein [Portunus trituberculatus]